MKKSIFITFAAIFAAVALISCDKTEVQSQKTAEQSEVLNKAPVSDDDISPYVRFVGQGMQGIKEIEEALKPDDTKNGMIIIIRGELGRKSKDCKKFGVCNLKIGPWTIWGNQVVNDRDILLPYDDRLIEYGHIDLLLAESSKIDMTKEKLYVDEEIAIFNDKDEYVATIKANDYTFVPTLGKFGGYVLDAVK